MSEEGRGGELWGQGRTEGKRRDGTNERKREMKLFIDCEWNSYKGELISMALVSSDGREFYEVLPTEHMELDPWVVGNVVPKLGKYSVSYAEFQSKLDDFLNGFASVHLIADWPEDVARFCDALIIGPGNRLDTPPLTIEIVRVDSESANPHNALADAWGLRNFFLGEIK